MAEVIEPDALVKDDLFVTRAGNFGWSDELHRVTRIRTVRYVETYQVVEYETVARLPGRGWPLGRGEMSLRANGRLTTVKRVTALGSDAAIMNLVKLQSGEAVTFWNVGGRLYA